MRLNRALPLLALLLLLSACGAGKTDSDMQKALDFRTDLLEAGGCEFNADVTANVGDSVYEFTLACSWTKDKTDVSVLSPENIAGISAEITDSGAQIAYDGASLELGMPKISAIAAPELLADCWAGEYISASGMDGDSLRVTYLKGYDDDELRADCWFDGGAPTYCEVTSGGEKILSCTISEFHITGKED